MSVARRFISKFGAASLHVACAEPEQRAQKSADQTAGLISFIASATLTKKERDQCCAMVVSDDRLMGADRARLLEIIDGTKVARRNGQKWGAAILNIFTQKDWDGWKSKGLGFASDILAEMMVRVRNLGGARTSQRTTKS